jgi:DNA-binding IclR family transcriptional regulator
MRTFQLGAAFARHLDLAREAQQSAAEVAAACGETVHVAVLDGTDVVYVAKVDSTGRELGLAYDECESNDAVHCVAAPVHDHTGAMVAAMSISVPSFRWSQQRRREWSELVRRGAAGLSERLGHRPASRRAALA